MATVSVSNARQEFSSVVERAKREPVHLERRGESVAVVISPERYDELMSALEDAEDNAAYDEAMAEAGPNVPWDDVMSDLGLK